MTLLVTSIDCSGVDDEGKPLEEKAAATLREMTPEEEVAHLMWQAQATAGAARLTEAQEQRSADLALLAASEDPHHQALARLLGA